MVETAAQSRNRSFITFLIFDDVTGGSAAIKLPLCHSLVRSVILFNKQ